MITSERKKITETILKREQLRPLSRFARLRASPVRTFPYYILAALSHVHPFPLTFPTLWGTHMRSYLPEGNTFFYYGYCEANVTNFFLRYVQKGMQIIDVGAHIGMYTMLASELVEGGHVHSFEPTPSTFRLLTENTKGLPNVSIMNVAVADTVGTVQFSDYGPGYSAYNTAHIQGGQGLSKKAALITVPTTTLDTHCTEHALAPSLIKLDAEGFEYQILLGMKTLLQTTSERPLIILEVAGGTEWAENRTNCFTYLKQHGYSAFELAQNGTPRPHHFQRSYTYDNLLFIPKERVEEVMHQFV